MEDGGAVNYQICTRTSTDVQLLPCIPEELPGLLCERLPRPHGHRRVQQRGQAERFLPAYVVAVLWLLSVIPLLFLIGVTVYGKANKQFVVTTAGQPTLL